MNKDKILIEIENLTAEDLAGFIKASKVTLAELRKTGDLNADKRKKIQELLEEDSKKDEEFWINIKEEGIESLDSYINLFPQGIYSKEAKEKRDKLIKKQEEEKKKLEEQKKEKLALLKDIKNSPFYEVKRFIENGVFTLEELEKHGGIPKKVIDSFDKDGSTLSMKTDGAEIAIPEGYTEVYFWGVKRSGKTTALGSILKTIDSMGGLDTQTGPGLNYMNQLKNIFNNEVAILPTATYVEFIQYLPFKFNEGNTSPIALIDLSGEIIDAFSDVASQNPLQNKHQQAYDQVMRLLKDDTNKKIHFFFIDYTSNDKVIHNGLTQSDLLNSTHAFFDDNNIFRDSTKAIYIVVTKSDLMPKNMDKVVGAKNHIQKKYLAFHNTLAKACKDHNINGRNLQFIPFSIGEVYWSRYCIPDKTSSKIIIEKIKEELPKQAWWHKPRWLYILISTLGQLLNN